MRLSISNIAWDETKDSDIYKRMQKYGFTGLEIAPTRIFPESPYEHLSEAESWGNILKKTYGFMVSSMQSIWFGRTENIFANEQERKNLIDYTKKAIDFASAVQCRNLVFGCPRNRNMPEDADEEIAVGFFRELGDYAFKKGTIIGMEANPTIYHTNFINDTLSAIELIQQVNSPGFLLNLDVGTMIENKESPESLRGLVKYINHVHISEPGLKIIEKRKLHKDLKQILEEEQYDGYISVEMQKQEMINDIDKTMEYVAELFR